MDVKRKRKNTVAPLDSRETPSFQLYVALVVTLLFNVFVPAFQDQSTYIGQISILW